MPEPNLTSVQPEYETARVEAVRGALISWFRENGRDLPWRRTRDPYRILVSEVMLQQIQVKRAVPFYLAFLERFPTVEALAGAPIAEAIRVWGDLGRYRRVVNLHKTAGILVEQFGGEVPSDPAALVKLPGVGPYTAGAVACFAFEKDVAFVDTNIRRVLHRLFLGVEVPQPSVPEAEILGLAESLVPQGHGWEWNQSVMELGALVCTARQPRCGPCPVSNVCRARASIPSASAGQPRAAKAGTAYRYEDSNRFYRGRVLARLRAAPEEGVALRELGAGLREGFTDEDLPWIESVVYSLEKDGLAATSGERPTPPAVAEDRPAHGAAAGGEEDGAGGMRVRLP